MTVVGIIVDGRWVEGSTSVDQIAGHLGQAVRLAQHLSPEDARRARDLVRAALATLEATTALPKPDQRTFERALRG